MARNPFFDKLREPSHHYKTDEVVTLFAKVDETRVNDLAGKLAAYISLNLPDAIEKRSGLSDYRTNPYVLLAAASVLKLSDVGRFSDFLFNSKFYMGLETSFGKQIEAAFVGQYPIKAKQKWIEAPEKTSEFALLNGLSREDRAKKRIDSVWREIDRSSVVGTKRFLTSIKSGPNTINDTQVAGMTQAIKINCQKWLEQSKCTYPKVTSLDVVLGLTYGTDRTTNNKENQILVKLLDSGFIEANPKKEPGILVDKATKRIRVYRRIGRDFWSFIGQPDKPDSADFVFLEILLALSRALGSGMNEAKLEDRINSKISQLMVALAKLRFPRNSLPPWVREKFSEDQLFWFATAMTAFYDEGI